MGKLLADRRIRSFLLCLGLMAAGAALLLFPQEAMAAAREGLALCGNVIVPSLFPFFVLSSLVVELGLAGYLGRALEKVMRPLFHVSGECASAVVLGFVGGYPVGARTAIELYRGGHCTRTEAERLLAFCNNSGPAFILGVVGAGVFADSRVGLLLYLAHAAASLCVGLCFRFYRWHGETGEERGHSVVEVRRLSRAFVDSVKGGCTAVLNICSFVVLFTVVIRLLVVSGFLPALSGMLAALFSPLGLDRVWAERLLTGALELTSGVWTLAGEGSLTGRTAMAAFLLGWAGLSVHCQTLSFLADSGLSARTYLTGKLLHGALSAAFMAALVHLLPLDEAAGAYLAEEVEGLARLDFATAISGSVAAAWCVFLLFFLAAVLGARKSGRKKRKSVV